MTLKRKSDEDEFDEIWAVFDCDEHPNISQAREQARKNEINIAYSNPCFELWLLLHFCSQAAQVGRHKVQRLVRGHLQRFDKRLTDDHWCALAEKYQCAVRRAKQLRAAAVRHGDGRPEPWTNVDELVDRILTAMRMFAAADSFSTTRDGDPVLAALSGMLATTAPPEKTGPKGRKQKQRS